MAKRMQHKTCWEKEGQYFLLKYDMIGLSNVNLRQLTNAYKIIPRDASIISLG